MTSYVDDAAILFKGKLRYHLTADSVAELHAFCAAVGINKCWFHRKSLYPHYDVTGEQRNQAIQSGALAVTQRELVALAKKLRPAPPSAPLFKTETAP